MAAAAQRLQEAGDARRTLVLVPGPGEALGLLERGVRFAAVNVGGLHYTAGRVQLGKAIFLSPEDREALGAMARKGVVLEGRALPGDAAQDVLGMLGGRP